MWLMLARVLVANLLIYITPVPVSLKYLQNSAPNGRKGSYQAPSSLASEAAPLKPRAKAVKSRAPRQFLTEARISGDPTVYIWRRLLVSKTPCEMAWQAKGHAAKTNNLNLIK